MNDRQHTAQRRRVERFHDKWKPIIGLTDWRGTLTLYRDTATMGELLVQHLEPCMEIDVAWQYQKYDLRVFLPALLDLDDSRVEEIVLHELLHVPIDHLADLLADRLRDQPIVEETVTKLTNAVARAYAAGIESA